MTEEQIKEMLNGIINNGEKWEYRWCTADGWSNWEDYKLGYEIYDSYEYRKVEKKVGKKTWLEEYLKQNLFKTNSIAYEETRYGITNVCKKILEEMKSNYVDKVTVSIFENIIKDLGVEL